MVVGHGQRHQEWLREKTHRRGPWLCPSWLRTGTLPRYSEHVAKNPALNQFLPTYLLYKLPGNLAGAHGSPATGEAEAGVPGLSKVGRLGPWDRDLSVNCQWVPMWGS